MKFCNDYGDNPECLGTADDRYEMDLKVPGEPPLLWCAHCGPLAHQMLGALEKAFDAGCKEFYDKLEPLVAEAKKTRTMN